MRDRELDLASYARSGASLLKYQDRILYGSDLSFDFETRHKETAAENWEAQ
jgi:hypothetical protein